MSMGPAVLERVVASLLDQVDALKAEVAELKGETPPKEGSSSEGAPLDGVTDFKKGTRDFSSANSKTKQIQADYTSKERVYTNGVTAPNRWREIKGGLNGAMIKLPDVNSGYPKSVYPTSWDGVFPSATQAFDIGEGLPDFNEARMKFGVIIPSTNTTVEYDFWRMVNSNADACKGVGFHMSGLLVEAPKLATDEDMLNFLTTFRRQLFSTVDHLMTAEPEYIIMGMSLETFFGGWQGNLELQAEITERCGLSVATGAEACKAALAKFGATRIAIITPYQSIGDKNVVKFFEEIGVEVVRIAGLKCGSATDIAHVPEEWCERIIKENLVVDGVQAILQAGTNLSMVPVSEKLEQELGLPVIPINVATLWFAMRQVGINDKLQGCTRLFREF